MHLNIIKAIYDKVTVNIIHNGEKLKVFSLKTGTKQRCPLLTVLFNIVLGVLSRNLVKKRQRKKENYHTLNCSSGWVWEFPGGSVARTLSFHCREHGFDPWSGTSCSPWARQESDTTERLHFHFSLSCIGEGNGNPLQCFCLENPWDRGAWWAAVCGVAQSRTRLKRLPSLGFSRQEHSSGLPFP